MIDYEWKNRKWSAWDWTRDYRMEGTDESTELGRPPVSKHLMAQKLL